MCIYLCSITHYRMHSQMMSFKNVCKNLYFLIFFNICSCVYTIDTLLLQQLNTINTMKNTVSSRTASWLQSRHGIELDIMCGPHVSLLQQTAWGI